MPPTYNSSLFQNAGVTPATPDASVTPQGNGGGNWLTHLLPTIGSVALPTIAALLAPETGGASLIAGAALSGLGSAGGKVAENLSENQNAANGVLGAGGEGLLGGAVGGVAGKALGGILGKLGSGVADTAAGQAAADYASPFSKIANTDAATGIREAIPFAQSLGIPGDPAAWKAAGALGTGSNGFITNELKGLTDGLPSISANDLRTSVGTALGEQGASKPITDLVNNQLNRIVSTNTVGSGAGATIGETADPTALLEGIQNLGNKINTYYKPGVQLSVNDSADLTALKNSQSLLEDHLYNSGGLDARAAAYNVSPELTAQIQNDTKDTPQLGQYFIDSLNNAQTGQDMRSAQSGLVQLRQIGSAADRKLSQQIPGVPDPTDPGIMQHLGAGAQLMGGHYLGALAAAGGGILGTAEKAGGMFSGLSPALQAAVTTGAGTLPANTFTHASDFTQGNGGSPLANTGSLAGLSQTGDTSPMNQAATAGQPTIDPGLLQRAVIADLQSTGGKNLGTIVPALQSAMYGGAGQLSGDQRNTVAASQTATQGLDGLSSAFSTAGGGQGPLIGTLANLTGAINPNLKAYTAESQGEATKIAAATGVSPQTALSMLPQVTDSQDIATQKLSRIVELLKTNASNATQTGYQTTGFGAGGSPIQGLSGLGSSAQVGAGLGAITR